MSDRSGASDRPHWTLDRRVPIAFLIGLVVQTVLVGIFIGSITSKVDNHDKRLDSAELKLERQFTQDGRVIRLETQMTQLIEGVAEIKAILRSPRVPPVP